MSAASAFFCSDLSRAKNEAIFGTAGCAALWILLEYPGPWGPKALESSTLSGRLKTRLRNLGIPGSRLLFIRQTHSAGRMRCFVAVCRERKPRILQVDLSSYEDLMDLDFAALAGNPSAERVGHPMVLVCTHGKHDKCCSKFGIPAFRAIRERMGQQAWQCSHVGGDRFAANVLCFPHGLYYGHVCPEDVEPVLAAYAEDRIRLENYRGRACYSRPVQAGEYFVRRQTGIEELDAFSFLDSVREGEKVWRVRFGLPERAEIHEVRFGIRANPFSNFLSCSAVEQKPVQQYELLDYVKPI